ncbi:hypothetical protein PV396_03625 [Streptomyces sp. ME02-8801-2C]|uniref:hypothetical protein n=1 Tax=Streptomyces sp. ME02-8801-2C TaxID=3028680 RepID=UPI0029B0316A|nr:hypothetical protein [Streptomyces sp. ME02-8801-2C]MDX3451044.1 hypothetical protein [Streptomyces sp. ME02-8801-2C]
MTREIWLGDVVRAAAALGVSDAAGWERVASLLGLGPGAERELPAQPPPDPTALLPQPVSAPGQHGPADDDAARPHVEPPGAVRPTPTDEEAALLVPVAHRPPRHTGWAVDPLPVPRSAPFGEPGPPQHLPLLAPRSTAAVLHAALARVTPEGDLDVERAADHLARGLPLAEIPRRPLPTLRYGVQILADISAAMEPFAQDVEDVVDQVRSLVGVAGTRVLRFADCPSRGVGTGPRGTWRPYQPPQHGTRVLLLSGLGQVGPAFDPHRGTEREWREILLRIRQHGCDTVALVPLPERLWPGWWQYWLRVVAWDRGTTVGRVVGGVR